MQERELALRPVKEEGFIHTLPVQLTALVGREQAMKTVCARLQRPEVRLVTLTGMGGVGKTRLGLQVATELLPIFADGVCFVSLASLRDSSLVVPTIARALGLVESAEQPLRLRLKAYLRNKHLLLLLDGFEHVARAAPLLVELLQTCPDLKALVTSRSLLHVRGEYEFHVPPLTLPDVEQLSEGEAFAHCASVALFVQCAQAIKSDFAVTRANARTIAEICICLEGLPLAIELAAARLRLLSPQALLAWLGQRLLVLTSGAKDVPERQQTLLKTLTWSYDLLSAREQRLFRQLSVFVDGCTLEAVEALYGAGAENALDEVGALVEKNLLQRTETASGETRLVMPEMIHEFGSECLKQSGEMEAAQRTHALYYLAFAEEIEQKPAEAALLEWLGRCERECANLRAALCWLVEAEEMEMATRLGERLWLAWFAYSHIAEVAVAEGDFVKAAWSGSAAQSLQKIMSMVAPSLEYVAYERAVPTACSRLGEQSLRAWSGERMPMSASSATPAKLTAREGEVLRLLTAGLTSAQIAEQLVVSRHTVNIHVSSIYSKLGVNSRSAATRYAFEHHLI